MFTRIALLGVSVCLVVGCAKKPPKPAEKGQDSAAAPKQLSPEERAKLIAKDKGPGAQEEKPNWLNDPRFNKKGEGGNLPSDAPKGGKPSWGITPPAEGWNGQGPPPTLPTQPVQPGIPGIAPPQPQPQLPPMGGVPPQPMGAVPAQPAQPMKPPQPPAMPPAANAPAPAAGGKTVTKADLNDVWVFIDNFSGASGKMPPPQLVYAALVEAKSPAADLVKGNYIILTGATTRESVWAYEKDAPTNGGWIATQNGPEQVTAKEFAQRLGR